MATDISTTASANNPAPAFNAWMAPLLALVAAYIDTLGFIALFGLFTAHVTGNFVLIGAAFVHGGSGMTLKFLAFPAFIAGVLVAKWTHGFLSARGSTRVLKTLLALEAMFLFAFAMTGILLRPDLDANPGYTAIATGMLGALAMGLQNGTSRLSLSSLVPTTVMTGNVTQIVIDLVDAASGNIIARERIRRFIPAVAGFVVGAVGGALAYVGLGFVAVLPVIAVLLVLIYIADPIIKPIITGPRQ
ncbi:YoaK family protein [Undibacterium sp. Tian12W]|uniref:YoaK family protein n=1 Tax=Undibacterium sp. Tian12W TaxID=3413054 RepID=UPI003BF4310C